MDGAWRLVGTVGFRSADVSPEPLREQQAADDQYEERNAQRTTVRIDQAPVEQEDDIERQIGRAENEDDLTGPRRHINCRSRAQCDDGVGRYAQWFNLPGGHVIGDIDDLKQNQRGQRQDLLSAPYHRVRLAK